MRTLALLLPAALLVTACRRPEVEAFRAHPSPLVVSVQSGLDRNEAVESEYAAALRARLALRTPVVPETGIRPEGAADLRIRVYRRPARMGSDPTPGEVGLITGVAVGTLSALAGSRDAVWNGLWWGLWAGAHSSTHRRYERSYGAVPPNLIRAEISLVQPGIAEPLWVFSVDPEEVLRAMDPLRPSELEDPQRVREEEAKAFARVVVGRLAERFDWPLRREPVYIGTPERKD